MEPKEAEVIEAPKPPAAKKKTGRPTLYRPEYCEKVIELGMKGYSIAQMAREFGVSSATVWGWVRKNPDFETAIEHARTYSLAWWETVAQENLDSRNFNAHLWFKSIAARFPEEYRDRQDLNITNKVDIAEAINAARNRTR